MIYLFIFAAALIVSAVLARFVRDAAHACGWVAAPKSARHLHERPIPRLGGIAILSSLVLVVTLAVAVSNLLHWDYSFSPKTLLGLLGPTLLIFALGLADDFHPLSPYVKFAVQILAAGWLFLGGCRITNFQLLVGNRQLGSAAGLVLTIFWVLLITNAFNLLDGLDGLAGGSALFASLVVFIVSLVNGDALTQVVTIALAGAIVGFLRYNFSPATIFMGDCGSLVIGFVLSAVSLASSEKASTAIAVAIPVVSFGLPILDTSMAVLRRFLNRKPLFRPDGEHIHHKLLQRGLSHRQAVVLLYAVSAFFALVSLALLSAKSSTIAVVLTIVGIGVFFGFQHLGYHEVDELRRVMRRTWEQKTIITNNLAIRRATDELARAETVQDVCQILKIAFHDNDFDGFEFSFSPELAVWHDGSELTPPVHYAWHREASTPGTGWMLQLDLLSQRGKVRGTFSVQRSYTTRSLRSDINCLTDAFAAALGAALQRTSERQASMLALRPWARTDRSKAPIIPPSGSFPGVEAT
jgi:UDP-GlcNAc:undecaprenyl-phosphate/decaprenyl-phosphate GlcNAc-1-phosphate transferase